MFKPLEDSHRIVELLDYFDSAYAIWTYRHYHDVVNSCIKKNWGQQYRTYIENINSGTYFDYSEPLNLTKQNTDFVQNIYHSSISEATCTAVIWYLRNTIYFDCKLYDNPRVLLVSYEKLVQQPVDEMSGIQKFIHLENKSSVYSGIHKNSINRDPRPILDRKVEEACSKLYQRLLAA
jgi:hypothetical protein